VERTISVFAKHGHEKPTKKKQKKRELYQRAVQPSCDLEQTVGIYGPQAHVWLNLAHKGGGLGF